jgi:hypothetical protein
MIATPNHTLQRTAADCRSCNRGVAWPPSLSLGRSAAGLIKLETWVQNEIMKRVKTSKEIKVERPHRATVSEKEALKRMKQFAKRKERFLATARASKS